MASSRGYTRRIGWYSLNHPGSGKWASNTLAPTFCVIGPAPWTNTAKPTAFTAGCALARHSVNFLGTTANSFWHPATSTEFYVLLPWKLPQLSRNLSGFHDSSHGYICIVHYCASSKKVELTTFSTTWLTHTVYETKGDSTVHWLLCFIGLGLGLGLGHRI